MSDLKKKSRFLARVLRHEPELIGVDLDRGGWVSEADLLNGCRQNAVPLTRCELREIVQSDDKSRFTLDGFRIRAAQGHSISVDLGLDALKPPVRLLHGTSTGSLDSIFKSGLEPRKRNFVHLHIEETTALDVGRRHGRPVILRVDASRMHADGFTFFKTENGIWLTKNVPVAYLETYVFETDMTEQPPKSGGHVAAG